MAIFALHLSGISSLLGAMNLNPTFLSRCLSSLTMCNSSCSDSEKKSITTLGSAEKNNHINNNKKNNPKKKAKLDEKWKNILGKTGSTKKSHKIAIEQINSGKPADSSVINDILSYCNISTNNEQLILLINTPSFIISNLQDKDNCKVILKNKLGLPNGKKRVPGIYIFTHLTTGRKYVGSSSELAFRLNGYINLTHRKTGILIPLLAKENLNNFTLEVFPFYVNYSKHSEIILEQYYLLNPKFTLNTVKVANNPSLAKQEGSLAKQEGSLEGNGSNAKSLYMYNRDMSILYYGTNQQIDFIRKFNIHHVTFSKHLLNGTYYLGKYFFSREPILTAKVSDIDDNILLSMLKKDRLVFNRVKPKNNTSKSVILSSIDDNNTIIFNSLAATRYASV